MFQVCTMQCGNTFVKEVRGCSRELLRELEGMYGLYAMTQSSPRRSWRRLNWRNHGCELISVLSESHYVIACSIIVSCVNFRHRCQDL